MFDEILPDRCRGVKPLTRQIPLFHRRLARLWYSPLPADTMHTMKKVVWGRRGAHARALILAALATMSTACASTGAVPRPFPSPGRPAAPASAPEAAAPSGTAIDGYALVGAALALRGAPYRNGGSDPSGFDCSGFTQYVFSQYGVALSRAVREQFQQGTSVKRDEVSPGDLLFFATSGEGVSHVAIAVGGDEFVHAPSSKGVVRVERLGSGYWSPRFVGARRVN
jgi:cell wall-associated NlpC family hydrolase